MFKYSCELCGKLQDIAWDFSDTFGSVIDQLPTVEEDDKLKYICKACAKAADG
jgi:hypothetical protein